jgi:hypothetical protein
MGGDPRACPECDGKRWVFNDEPLEGHPDGAHEYWWAPCQRCNDGGLIGEPPDEEFPSD